VPAPEAPAGPTPGGPTRDVPLGAICGARSGDKGGNANVGLWVRTPDAYRWLASFLTAERLRALVPEARPLEVERHELPNILAVNFVLKGLLGDGVAASLRSDPQAKSLGEYLRAKVVPVPVSLLAYVATSDGVSAIIPSGARISTTKVITGPIAFPDNVYWPSLANGYPSVASDLPTQWIAPIVEINPGYKTQLVPNELAALTIKVSTVDWLPYNNHPLTVTLGQSPALMTFIPVACFKNASIGGVIAPPPGPPAIAIAAAEIDCHGPLGSLSGFLYRDRTSLLRGRRLRVSSKRFRSRANTMT